MVEGLQNYLKQVDKFLQKTVVKFDAKDGKTDGKINDEQDIFKNKALKELYDEYIKEETGESETDRLYEGFSLFMAMSFLDNDETGEYTETLPTSKLDLRNGNDELLTAPEMIFPNRETENPYAAHGLGDRNDVINNALSLLQSIEDDIATGRVDRSDTPVTYNKPQERNSINPDGNSANIMKEKFQVTSEFGPRSSPGGIGSTNHQGIDIGTPAGTQLFAPKSGIVTFAGEADGYGNLVKIKHDDGTETRYGHLSSISSIKVGERIEAGDLFALTGNTGNSTGPHLHFEVRDANGTAIDPRKTEYAALLGIG